MYKMSSNYLYINKQEIALAEQGFNWIVVRAFGSKRKLMSGDNVYLKLRGSNKYIQVKIIKILKEYSLDDMGSIQEMMDQFKKIRNKSYLKYLKSKYRKLNNANEIGFLAIEFEIITKSI